MDIKINLLLFSRYNQGRQVEADESSGLVWIPLQSTKSWDMPSDLLSQMTPHCRGGLRLLHMYLNIKVK